MTAKTGGEVAKYLLLAVALAFSACTPAHTVVAPSRPEPMEPLIRTAIADGKLPGAVVLVGLGERTLYHTAIGQRAVGPSPEPMTPDTIFDLASLTKV